MTTHCLFNTNQIREAVRSRICADSVRLNWMAFASAGLRSDDILHVCGELYTLTLIAKDLGIRCDPQIDRATVVILQQPRNYEQRQRAEKSLRTKADRLEPGCRMLIFNDESDMDGGMLFERATACVFDRQSQKILRIFDSPVTTNKDDKRARRPRSGTCIEVELSDINDSSLAIQASNIAALR